MENNCTKLVGIALLFSSIFFFIGLATVEEAYRLKKEVADYKAMSERIDKAQQQMVELKAYCWHLVK